MIRHLLVLAMAAGLAGCVTVEEYRAQREQVWTTEYVSTAPPRVIDAVAAIEVEVPTSSNEFFSADAEPMAKAIEREFSQMFTHPTTTRTGSEQVLIKVTDLRWLDDGGLFMAMKPTVSLIDPATGRELFRQSRRTANKMRAYYLDVAEVMGTLKTDLARAFDRADVTALLDPNRAIAAAPRPAPLQPQAAPSPRLAVTAPPPPRFAEQPKIAAFPKGPERADDVAVIIGNADYTRQGRDIPDVRPAHADAEGARRYATQALGIKDGNVILMKDATGAQMTRVFGSERDHRGQLFDWVKPGRSRVFVYYSGHGAPGATGGSPYLVPADADAARIELNGYPLKQLYDNLGKLPAESVTLVLEACFSGLSPAGSVMGKASPVFFEVKAPLVPANLTVITAGAANQVASWEPDDGHGLFTRHFLEGMAGKADANKDGKVSLDELDSHLKETLTYLARRHYGRDQNAQIVKGGSR